MKEKNKNKKTIKNLGNQIITGILILAILVFFLASSKTDKEKTISLSDLAGKINAGLVEKIDVELGELKIQTLDDKT
jgi:hypothetical protein